MDEIEEQRPDLSRLKTVREYLILAICYFLAGYAGISNAVESGYASIIWPASGIALCALLLRGGGLWPGVWCGSFAVNLMVGFDASADFTSAWTAVAIAGSIGTGAALQALAGLRMARLFADGIELTNAGQIARAAGLVIVLPCSIASTTGVATMFLARTIEAGMVLENWLTWYFGDLLGIILVLPILLLSGRSPVAVRWQSRSLRGTSSLVAISLTTTLLLTFYLWNFISERENAQAEAEFAAMAASTDEALRHRLQIYQRGLEGGAAFVAGNGGPTPSQWRDYVERIEIARSYPGMRGFGIFEAVAQDDLAAFRAQFTREFGEQFEVHPQVQRDEHFVINRIEPLDRNLAALGLDLAFEHGRREAIALSTQRSEPVLTRPIVLVQDERQGAGFLLMLPVLDDADEPSGLWVYSPLVAEELLAALTPKQGDEFALEVYHGETINPHSLLFTAGQVEAAPRFALQRSISLAGQPMLLRWTSLPPFERRYASSAPFIVLASGLTITVLLAILLVIFLRREGHVVRKVNEATTELAERNHLLEMAEATAHIGHWHIDLADDSIRWSDEVCRLHGLTPGEVPPLEKAMAFYHPDDRVIVQAALDEAVATGQPFRVKARLLTKPGEVRHIEMRGRVDTDSRGKAAALLGVIIDRTDETLMRERLTETIEEARAADKAKSSFLANMSHEIRTPMNGVIGFTELALAEEQVPAQKRRLQMIADSGNAMLTLLNDLLDFAKIEAKQLEIVTEPTDLRHTMRSCQRLMEPVAKAQNLSLDLEIDPSIPSSVLLDKMRLRQIVLNLLGNALKFTSQGGVQILVSKSPRRDDRSEQIDITVSDTGIGIPADRLESIFGKFTQADETTARRYGGSGLGLSISTELAELMGGEIRAESELGEGSSFTLSLPLEQGAKPTEAPIASEPVDDNFTGARLRVLVAEDNPVNQELTTAMVEKAGHICDLVCNGQEAVDAVIDAHGGRSRYDMVLMDMQMPVMDGLQASRAIREAGIDAAALPILAVTANAYADDIQRCESAGMQAHLAKPLRLRELRAAIARWSAPLPSRCDDPQSTFEETTDPRLQKMFEDSKTAVIEAVDGALSLEHPADDAKREIARLLHQIVGVAAYFGQETLGERCRSYQRELLNTQDEARVTQLLQATRGCMAADMGEQP